MCGSANTVASRSQLRPAWTRATALRPAAEPPTAKVTTRRRSACCAVGCRSPSIGSYPRASVSTARPRCRTRCDGMPATARPGAARERRRRGCGLSGTVAADRDRGADRLGGIRAAELRLLWGGDAGGNAGGCAVLLGEMSAMDVFVARLGWSPPDQMIADADISCVTCVEAWQRIAPRTLSWLQ